jgi:hypothetical protein
MAKEKKDLRKEIRELNYSEFKRLKLIEELYERGGEIIDNEDELLERLNTEIETKITGFASILVNKDLESHIEKLKERKAILEGEIKLIEKLKLFVKLNIHKYIEKNGSFQIDLDGIIKYAKAGYTTVRTIDPTAVPEEKGTYNVKLKAHDFLALRDAVSRGDIAISLNDFERKLVLKDLDEDDPAISKKLNPQVKFTKTP